MLLTIGTIKVTADMVLAILELGATLFAAFKLTQEFTSDLADYIAKKEAAKKPTENTKSKSKDSNANQGLGNGQDLCPLGG